MKKKISGLRSGRIVAVPALVLLVLLGYASALQSDFAYDDFRLIVRNDALGSPGALLDSFRGDYYRSTLDVGHLGYYRPLSVMLNVIDRRIWELDARGYHLTNLLLHILAALVLWLLLGRFLREPWAFLAVALFALHPTRAESVTFISGRVDLLATIFYLATLLVLTRRRRAGPIDLALAGLLAIAALLAKEMAITLLLVGPLLAYRRPALATGRSDPVSRDPVSHDATGRAPGGGGLPAAWRALAAIGAAVAVVAVARGIAMGELTGHGLAPLSTWPQRLIATQGEYLRALLLPAWTLRLEPDLVVDRWTAGIWPAALLLAAAVFAVIRGWNRAPAIACGILACLLALLPVAQLVPLETTWAERFSYLPAALASLAVGGIAAALAARLSRRTVIMAITALLLLEGVSLWHRNQAWRDDATLWQTVLAAGGTSAKVLNNRGVNLMDRGELTEAGVSFRQALALDPTLPTAHFNLGVVHWSAGRLDSALLEVRAATRLRPHDLDFALKLGSVALAAGHLEEATAAYRAALKLRPQEVAALVGLAAAHRRRGDFDAALALDLRALEQQPDDLDVRHGLAADHYARGELELSRRLCEEVLAVAPGRRQTLFLRGRVREGQGELEGALVDYQAATGVDAESIPAWVQSGRLLATLGRPCEAAEAFATAARMAVRPPEIERLQQAATALAAECRER